MLVALKEPVAAAIEPTNAARVNNPNSVAPSTTTISCTTSIVKVAIDG